DRVGCQIHTRSLVAAAGIVQRIAESCEHILSARLLLASNQREHHLIQTNGAVECECFGGMVGSLQTVICRTFGVTCRLEVESERLCGSPGCLERVCEGPVMIDNRRFGQARDDRLTNAVVIADE